MSERQDLLTLGAAHIAFALASNPLSAFSPAELLEAAKRDDIVAATREDICKRLALIGAYDACREIQALPAPATPRQPVPTATGWSSGTWGGATWGSSSTK